MIRDHLRGVLHIKKQKSGQHVPSLGQEPLHQPSLVYFKRGEGSQGQFIAPCGIGRNNIAHYPSPWPISCAKRKAFGTPRIFSMEGPTS
jgi:hypothetical protein